TQASPKGMEAYNLDWSPDGTRIASLADDSHDTKSQLSIWDASTGGHLQTIPFNTAFRQVLWSPAGKYLALSNLQSIMILDSHTGHVVKTFDYGTDMPLPPTSMISPATGSQPLSNLFPQAGSGGGFTSLAWTPDGSTLAVCISSGVIDLFNPLTGVIK